MSRETGFSNAEKRAAAREALNGDRRCETCHSVGLAGESVPGRAPGDVIVWADSTGLFGIEDDQGHKWYVEHAKLRDASFEAERQQAHAAVDARFDALQGVLDRLAALPDHQLVPMNADRLLDLEDAEVAADEAARQQREEAAEKERETKRDKAVLLLRGLFAKAADVPAKDAIAAADAAGISSDAVYRARRVLGVEVRKVGRSGWVWRLPSKVQLIKASEKQAA